jgi:hypothetical protein
MSLVFIVFDTEFCGKLLLALALAICHLDERGFPKKMTTKKYCFYRKKEHEEGLAGNDFWNDHKELLKNIEYEGNLSESEMYRTASEKILKQIVKSKKNGKIKLVTGCTTDINALGMLGEEFTRTLYTLEGNFQDIVILKSLYSSSVTLEENLREHVRPSNPYKSFGLKNPAHQSITKVLSKLFKPEGVYTNHDPADDAIWNLVLYLSYRYCTSTDALIYMRELVSGSVSI